MKRSKIFDRHILFSFSPHLDSEENRLIKISTMDDETYCIGVALMAMLLSMLGLLIVSVVGPLIFMKVKSWRKKPSVANGSKVESEEPALKAELSLIETNQATTYYQLMCPVYIAEQDINEWIEVENQKPKLIDLELEAGLPSLMDSETSVDESKIRSTFKPLINPRNILVEEKSKPFLVPTEDAEAVRSRKILSSKRKTRKRVISKSKTNKRASSKPQTHKSKRAASKLRKSKKESSSDNDSSSSSSGPAAKRSTSKRRPAAKRSTSKRRPADS